MKKLQESKTEIIKRSEINLNPINPKNHEDEAIKQQKRNFQKVGYLGGIVWNRLSGNLIDGHRRIYAMDRYYNYPENDYDIKVEVVELDDKTEKEQLTYMAIGNTKADINLIAGYIDDIDYKNAGISEDDFKDIIQISDSLEDVSIDMTSIDDIISPKKPETREQIKDKKERQKEKAYERQKDEDSFVVISFSDYQGKVAFCEMLGYDPDDIRYIKGEDFLGKLNNMM